MTASRQTRLKMRKGFTGAPMSYKVLMVEQFTPSDQKVIAKGLIKAITPTTAIVLLPGPDDHLKPREKRSKWSLFKASTGMQGAVDLQILRYKGSDVAVFFKRQTSIVTPEPEDPAPEGYITNEDDLWVRFDLFGKSPRQLVGAVREELTEKDREIQRLRTEVETQTSVINSDAKTITSLRRQLSELQAKTAGKSRGKQKR